MKLYTCKVRLHGDVRDEVRKRNITSGEIRLLRQIHGEDAVLEIALTGVEARSDDPSMKGALRTEEEERDRLVGIYGEKAVGKLFGVKPVALNAEVEPDAPLADTKLEETPKMMTRRRAERPEDLVT